MVKITHKRRWLPKTDLLLTDLGQFMASMPVEIAGQGRVASRRRKIDRNKR
jgi:hypothetical protein